MKILSWWISKTRKCSDDELPIMHSHRFIIFCFMKGGIVMQPQTISEPDYIDSISFLRHVDSKIYLKYFKLLCRESLRYNFIFGSSYICLALKEVLSLAYLLYAVKGQYYRQRFSLLHNYQSKNILDQVLANSNF